LPLDASDGAAAWRLPEDMVFKSGAEIDPAADLI
jgi:hypothetical protein